MFSQLDAKLEAFSVLGSGTVCCSAWSMTGGLSFSMVSALRQAAFAAERRRGQGKW